MADIPIAKTASLALPPVWGVHIKFGNCNKSKSTGGSSS